VLHSPDRLLLIVLVSAMTAVTSNVATSSIFLPVVSGLAQSMHVHPLSFMVPVALSCSLAFVLPVSTPPNARAFASGRLAVSDMASLGSAMTAFGILTILVAMHTIGVGVFNTSERPLPAVWVLAHPPLNASSAPDTLCNANHSLVHVGS
jgi:sodium-dependent dicarboxylate transporter 2/3/5